MAAQGKRSQRKRSKKNPEIADVHTYIEDTMEDSSKLAYALEYCDAFVSAKTLVAFNSLLAVAKDFPEDDVSYEHRIKLLRDFYEKKIKHWAPLSYKPDFSDS